MAQLTLPERGIESLFGTHDENLKRIQRAFGVQLAARGNRLQWRGLPEHAEYGRLRRRRRLHHQRRVLQRDLRWRGQGLRR